MSLELVREALSGFINHELDLHNLWRNKEHAAALFSRGNGIRRRDNIAGDVGRGHDIIHASLALRHGRDGATAEREAHNLYNALCNRLLDYNGQRGFILTLFASPVWLGQDSRGVHEFIIDFDFYIEKEAFDGLSSE